MGWVGDVWKTLDVLGSILKLSLVEAGICFFKAAELKAMLLYLFKLSYHQLGPK